MYSLFVCLHILAAILLFGPCFAQPLIFYTAKTPEQIRWSMQIMKRLGKFYQTGDWIMLATGVLLVILGKWPLTTFWIDAAVVLLLAMRILSRWGSQFAKAAADLILSYEGEDTPQTYFDIRKKLQRVDMIIWVMNLGIVLLMIVKP